MVKIREKAIKWDMAMTESRRTLNWEKQIALSINPEEAERTDTREGQHPGNNVPCAICGSACVTSCCQNNGRKVNWTFSKKLNHNSAFGEEKLGD